MDKAILDGMGVSVIPTAPDELIECPYCRGLTHERSKCERCTAPTGITPVYEPTFEPINPELMHYLWKHLSDTKPFFDWGFGITS
jgi:hypothetical protein